MEGVKKGYKEHSQAERLVLLKKPRQHSEQQTKRHIHLIYHHEILER